MRTRGYTRRNKGAEGRGGTLPFPPGPPCTSPELESRTRGYTYIGLLLAIVLAGIALAAAGTLWTTEVKRDREAELLFAGDQIRRAIAAYYETVPGGQARQFPAKLEDLLKDNRWQATRRHLRRIYIDPMTSSREWGIVRGPGETITGVYSLSTAAPLKHAGFPKEYQQFASAASYRDWRFVYQAPQAPLDAPKANSGATTPTTPTAQRAQSLMPSMSGAPSASQ